MTLDEAIDHAEKEAVKLDAECKYSCAREHRQLAIWLNELKERRKLKN